MILQTPNEFLELLWSTCHMLSEDEAAALQHNKAGCPVCLCDFEAGDELCCLPCAGSHAGHWACMQPWLAKASTCPCCRFKLPEGETNRLTFEPLIEKTIGALERVKSDGLAHKSRAAVALDVPGFIRSPEGPQAVAAKPVSRTSSDSGYARRLSRAKTANRRKALEAAARSGSTRATAQLAALNSALNEPPRLPEASWPALAPAGPPPATVTASPIITPPRASSASDITAGPLPSSHPTPPASSEAPARHSRLMRAPSALAGFVGRLWQIDQGKREVRQGMPWSAYEIDMD